MNFFERRIQNHAVDFKERRSADRRREQVPVTQERRRLATQIRKNERPNLHVPVRFTNGSVYLSGHTQDMSPEGMSIDCDVPVNPGSPLNLQFSHGRNVCSLNFSGKVVYCNQREKFNSSKRKIGIKFSGDWEWEKLILTSAIVELKKNHIKEDNYLLTVKVSR
jgi:PilZ domain